jgi:transmembrane sensor
MQKEEAYFLHLLSGFIENNLSEEKVKELFDLIAKEQSTQNSLLNHPLIKEKLEILAAEGRHEISDLMSDRMRDRLLSAIEISEIQKGSPHGVSGNQPNPVFPQARVRRLVISRFAAAAVILLIIAPAAYLFIQSRHNKNIIPVQTAVTVSDITPGIHKPVLTLAGGQQIILDSAASQAIAKLSNTYITTATTGRLSYVSQTAMTTDNKKPAEEYNTLTNPRGAIVTSLTLSDGTRVWLNAGSSITYPVTFTGNERKVKLTGEAYFEVVHNAKRPFSVTTDRQQVEDIGTAFNVNAYSDEEETRTTLIEGSVSVNKTIIRPGEQLISTDVRMKTAKADLESTMAWKNGEFLLKGTDLNQLLRQVSRWYDVDIDNKNNHSNIKFGGSIARTVNLSTVIEALRLKGVKCSLEGKTLVVE